MFSFAIEALLRAAEGHYGCQVKRGPDGARVRKLDEEGEADGLHIFPDGTAIRLGVDLSVAAAIRSIKTMRKVLGMPEPCPKCGGYCSVERQPTQDTLATEAE